MDKQQETMLARSQVMEQVGAEMRDNATVVAGYYRKLIDEGVPKQIAAMLTSEMQDQYLTLMLTPRPAPGQG